MLKESQLKQYKKGFLAGIHEGNVSVPYLLIKHYHHLNLTDMEAMLLIHLMTFKEKEQKDFPTIEEIQARMASTPEKVISALQSLMKAGILTIDEEIDPLTDVQYENYNLYPLYEKLAEYVAEALVLDETERISNPISQEDKNIFIIFEKEFARPLSPMESETISIWIDQDKYSQELIVTALKEAVFAGKLHFRYIDRILLEWSRQRVHTAEQAKEFTQKFRGKL